MTEDSGTSFGDPLTAPFWAAAAERRLVLQQCKSCKGYQHYPRPYCLRCQSNDVVWVEASGRGTVYALTRNHLPVHEQMQPPYIVALIELDEGPRMVSNLDESRDAKWAIGDRVEIGWRERPGAPPLPVFVRAQSVEAV